MRKAAKILLIVSLIVFDVCTFCVAQNDWAFGAAAKLKSRNERFNRTRDHYKQISIQMTGGKKSNRRRTYRAHRRNRIRHRVRFRRR